MPSVDFDDDDREYRRRQLDQGGPGGPSTPPTPSGPPWPQDDSPPPDSTWDPGTGTWRGPEPPRQPPVLPDFTSRYGFDVDASDRAAYAAGRLSEDEIRARMDRRGASTADRQFDSQSGYYDTHSGALTPAGQAALAARQNPSMAAGAGRQTFGVPLPGSQFSADPYTKLLEDIAQEQLGLLRQPQSNPALDKLLAFLDTRFSDLTTHPGFSPEDQALLRTQALDPIEQDRAASQRRSLERTAARGMLPSSGLAELDSRDVDVQYDKLRGAVERDLGVNAITRRDRDLAQALTIGQLAGITIPGLQRTEDTERRRETLGTANLLYQLPRQALMDALSVVNGSGAPPDLFSQAVQLLSGQQQGQRLQQQQDAAFLQQIGELWDQLFG